MRGLLRIARVRLWRHQKALQGFTLIELLVISPIIMVITIATITFLFNEYGGLVKQNSQLDLQLEAQDILFGLQDDLWFANQFASDLNSNLVDSYQPTGGWRYNTTPPTLIVSTAALTTNRRNPNRQPVYINESSCTPPDGNGVNSVLYNNVIYFISGSNLYKRVITAPNSLPVCGNLYQKQTCPANHTSSTCLADTILSNHISSFSLTYYNSSGAVIAGAPEPATSVKVTISLKDKAFGEDITANSSLRLRKINQ